MKVNQHGLTMPPVEKLVSLTRTQKYKGDLPFFYSPQLFPELDILKDNWKGIRDEILTFEKSQGDIKSINSNKYVSAQFEGINWANMYLDNFMWRFHHNRKHFPFICSLVAKIPNCTLTVISILSPHSSIKPHYGDTNGIVRCQLGLSIPAPHPHCYIKVGDEERGWEEGEFVIFTEAHMHSVRNDTSKKRYILIVDIVPPFIKKSKTWVCARVLGGQTFNYLEARFPWLKKIPDTVLSIPMLGFSLAWYLYLPLQRRLKFL